MGKLIIIVFAVFSLNVLGEELDYQDALRDALEEIRIQNGVPAMAVAIITAGEVSFIEGFGFLDEIQTKPTTDKSLFRIASMSKLFTAQAVMQLAEKGELALDDKVSLYLPKFEDNHISIRQLLTHSSGISDTIRPVGFDTQRSVNDYLGLVSDSISSRAAESAFEYSDTNFNILGGIISAVSGQQFEDYVYDNVLKPSVMEKSQYFNELDESFVVADPTYKGKLIKALDQRPYDRSFNPSEGLISNVYDLSHWLKLTLEHNTLILKEQTYKEMLVPQLKTSWGQIYMGLGWQVYKVKQDSVARHPGSIRGYKSLVLAYPDSKNAMILLSNSSDTPRWEIEKVITKILKNNSVWQ